MRYVVREGQVRGEGAWLSDSGWARLYQANAMRFDDRDDAANCARIAGGRVVRLVSREEAKQLAAATARTEALGEVCALLSSYVGGSGLRDLRKRIEAMSCPCQGPLDDPGPEHVAACPWKDPEYVPAGGMW